MIEQESDLMRCLMQAMEENFSPKQAREECGCNDKRAAQPASPLTQTTK